MNTDIFHEKSNIDVGKRGILNSRLFKIGKIQKRIILLTLSSILVMCILITAASYYIFHNYLQSSLISSTETNLKMLSDTINSNINDVYRMARFCQGSSDIAKYIKASPEPGSVLSVSTYDRLYEEYLNNSANSYIPRVVVSSGGHYLQVCQTSFSTSFDLAKSIPELPFFEEILSADGYDYSEGIIEDPFMRGNPRYVIPLIRPISYQFRSNQAGFLYMEITEDIFTSPLNHYYMEEGSRLYLVMCDHTYNLSSNSAKEVFPEYKIKEDISSVSVSGAKVYDINSDFGDETFVIFPLNMEGCFLAQSVSNQEISRQLRLFWAIIIAILIAILTIGIMLVIMLNNLIHKPLARIRLKIDKTSAGDFGRDPSIEADHELGEIGKGINDLSESVEKLLNSRVEAEKQKRDLEYQMLQSQINPHFLYNTLNSIKMMATIQGATGISEMTTALASLMRSISKGTSLLVPISEELSLVKDYFTIQNYRYGGMIDFTVNIEDEAITDDLILKFTLQPLVENAIFHGLEPGGGTGNIIITIKYLSPDAAASYGFSYDKINAGESSFETPHLICLEVYDNGVGMSSEKVSELTKSGTKSEGKSEFFKEIGISNVQKRLQYEFGEEYGLFIESEINKFTCVRVIIPEQNL